MKNGKHDIPECVRRKHCKELKRRLQLGCITLAEMSQSDRDLIHMNEDEECLAYWTQEKALAIDTDNEKRLLYVDSIRRYLLLVTHKPPESDTDCPLLALLDNIQEEARSLPAVHHN